MLKITFVLGGAFALTLLLAAQAVVAQTSSQVPAPTGPVLTLANAISEGLGDAPTVKLTESQKNEAYWKKMETYQLFLPSVSVTGTYIGRQNYLYVDIPFLGQTFSMPNIVPTYLVAATATLPLYDGFASVNKYKGASAMESAAANQHDWNRFKTERQISLLYYQALGSKILQEVANQNLTTLNDHLSDVRLFKKAGVSTNYDVLRVEVQVSEAKSDVMNSVDNVSISRSKLAEVIGKQEDNRELVGDLPILSADVVKDLKLDDFSDRKDIQGEQGTVSGLDYMAKASNRFWVPQFAAFATYDYYNNRNQNFPDAWAFRDAYSLGISMSWNIFDGMGSISRSRESVEQSYQAERKLEMSKLEASHNYEVWRRKFLYYCSVYQSRVDDVQKATESVRLAKEGRRVGARTNTDLLDAESDLFRSKAGLVNAQLGAVEALINLELTTGKRLLN